MRDIWLFRSVDWISMWKIYSSLFITVFILTGFALKYAMACRFRVLSPTKMWGASSLGSVGIAYCAPVVALPGCALLFFVAGRHAVESFLSVVPIAASLGAAGTLIDTLILRVLYKQGMDRGRVRLSFIANGSIALVAITVVIVWELLYPPQIIALT